MGKIINISTSANYKDWYQGYAERVAKKYPDYTIIVDGGACRGYDCRVELNREEKEIHLDYYLPLYIDKDACYDYICGCLEEWRA